MVLSGYNHLTTIVTTAGDNRCLGTITIPQANSHICYPYRYLSKLKYLLKIIRFILWCHKLYGSQIFFYFGWHGGCWWLVTCLLHNADIGWSMNAGSSQYNNLIHFDFISHLHKHKLNIHFDVILSKHIWSHNLDPFVQSFFVKSSKWNAHLVHTFMKKSNAHLVHTSVKSSKSITHVVFIYTECLSPK